MRKICMLLVMLLSVAALKAQPIKNIEIIISSSLQEAGELPYSHEPISWKNFLGKPDNSCKYIAMTYSGIKMKYEYQMRNGVPVAKVFLFPYMDIKQSWYKKEALNDSTLAHEQRHFDITAIITSQFAAEIKKKDFNVSNFSSELQKMQQAFIKKMQQMQQQYDSETEHGIRHEQQAAWDKRLTEEIKKSYTQS